MPYFPTTQAWLTQSALLLEARPTTTRITTKYTLCKPRSKARTSKTAKTDPTAPAPAGTEPPLEAGTASSRITRATLTLKTYDPVSGVTLKYKTAKAAEVGRLISSLARLGRSMAGLLEKDDALMLDAQTAEGGAEIASGMATPVPEGAAKVALVVGKSQAGGGQGGKKGKKKGKK